MCINSREIKNIYTGNYMYVPCGHCPECLMRKASRNEVRMRLEFDKLSRNLHIFITLNYSNNFIPYVDITEYTPNKIEYNVYRRFSIRTSYNRHNNRTKYIVKPAVKPIALLPFDKVKDICRLFSSNGYETSGFPKLTNFNNDNCFGVAFSKDFSDFIKRLRRRLEYHGLPSLLSYFRCSEYGPTTLRPHFHGVLSFDAPATLDIKTFYKIKAAIASCWCFCSYQQIKRNIEIARDPARYISRYVASSHVLHPVYKIRTFKARTSHSLGYGFASVFSPHIFKAFFKQSLPYYYRHVDVSQGVSTTQAFRMPNFVLYRYVPKFKGFYKLSDDELSYFLSSRTYRNINYYRIGITEKELHAFERRLYRAVELLGMSYLDYAYYYVKFFRALRISLNRDINDEVELYEHYYNIEDVYLQKTSYAVLEEYFEECSPIFNQYLDIGFDLNRAPSVLSAYFDKSAEYFKSFKKIKNNYRVYSSQRFCDEHYISLNNRFYYVKKNRTKTHSQCCHRLHSVSNEPLREVHK